MKRHEPVTNDGYSIAREMDRKRATSDLIHERLAEDARVEAANVDPAPSRACCITCEGPAGCAWPGCHCHPPASPGPVLTRETQRDECPGCHLERREHSRNLLCTEEAAQRLRQLDDPRGVDRIAALTTEIAALRERVAAAGETGKGVLTRWWDEERTLLLVSPDLFRLLPDGVVLKSISGQRVTKGKDQIDDDIRAGVMAFGFEMSPPNSAALREETNAALTRAAHAADAELGMELLHQRLDEAHVFAQEASGKDAKYWGRNVWHVALDEAKRLKARADEAEARVAELERLLAPLAALAEHYDDEAGSSIVTVHISPNGPHVRLLPRHAHEAAAALKKIGGA